MFVNAQPRINTDSIRCYIIIQTGQQSSAKPPRPPPQGLLHSKVTTSETPMESIGSLIVWPVFEGPSHRQTWWYTVDIQFFVPSVECEGWRQRLVHCAVISQQRCLVPGAWLLPTLDWARHCHLQPSPVTSHNYTPPLGAWFWSAGIFMSWQILSQSRRNCFVWYLYY